MNNQRHRFEGILTSFLFPRFGLPAVEPGPGLAALDSGVHDFDFLHGAWRVHHRRLKERLSGCTEWVQFDGECRVLSLLDGAANVDDNYLELPDGHYRAASLRSYDREKQQWSIWWLDGRQPGELEAPVVGRFTDGLGEFHAEIPFKGKPTRIRFRWTQTTTGTPRWEQAFSPDNGQTWETNWIMAFTRRSPNARSL